MDRRQVKSRKAILKAFDELMSIKNFEKITVTEIADVADVGKSTFYCHFDTKEDLVGYICADFFEHLKETEKNGTYSDLNEQLTHLFWHIYDEKSVVLKLIKDEDVISQKFFVKYLEEIFNKYVHCTGNINKNFAINHITNSFVTALRWHIKQNNGSYESVVRDFIYCNKNLLY